MGKFNTEVVGSMTKKLLEVARIDVSGPRVPDPVH
jgi:hypothetical protein